MRMNLQEEHLRDVEMIAALQEDHKDVESMAVYQLQQQFRPGLVLLRETEKSVRANVCNDVRFLHRLLHHLLEQRHEYSNLTNLLFHGVSWQPEGIQLLCSFLGAPESSVKQLEFQDNVFVHGLVPLSEMLQRSSTIEAVVFSRCGIGTTGAVLLASALAKNRSVQELQVWEDSIGSKGAEELSKMIEVNHTLKLLLFALDSRAVAVTAPLILISAVLARNRRVEVHIWGSKNSSTSKVVEFMPEDGTLRIYNHTMMMTSSTAMAVGLVHVVCALAWNTNVTTLDMSGIPVRSKCARELRGVLERNRSLKDLKLSSCCLRDTAVVYIAAGLFKNSSLESLSLDGNWFGGVGVEHLLCPLSTFSPLQNQANTALKSLSFGGGSAKIRSRDSVSAILQLLGTNQSLNRLAICDDASLRPNDIVKIFTSLERNASLRSLCLKGCRGVEGELVLDAIMETLEVNPWIEEIDLHGTPLHAAGSADQIYEKLGQNGSSLLPADVTNLLSSNADLMPLATPTFCRVFLCGQDFAGKNTLCNSIMSSAKSPPMDATRALANPVDQQTARPDKVKMMCIDDGDTRLRIWNLSGHEENVALHDFMLAGHGGGSSFYVAVSSLCRKPADSNKGLKTVGEIEEELTYWLKFLASNSNSTSRRSSIASNSILPHVTIVLTHFDKAPALRSQGLHPIAALMQKLRAEFDGYVEMYPTVFAVDARSPVSVSRLTHHLRKTSKTIIQRVPQVYKVCNDLVNILPDAAAMRWPAFCEICQLKVPALRLRSRRDNTERVEARRRAVAKALHNLGEVVFLEDLGVLIISCGWFYRDVLGQLMEMLKSRKTDQTAGNNGFICRKELEKILREEKLRLNWGAVQAHLDANDLISIMLKLELCYELDHGDPNTLLLVPAILEQRKQETQRWELKTTKCMYSGRRLECEDTHMFIAPSFFPRLQVRLHNRIECSTMQRGGGGGGGGGGRRRAVYNLEKNLIDTVINGVHVRVLEPAGVKLGSYIDVLACSSTKTVSDMVRLLHQHIIPTILNLLPSSITLTESIIRPDCVKHCTPQRFRTSDQHLPLKKLKQILLSLPAESMYDYQHTWAAVVESGSKRLILEPASDHARDLLSDDEFREVLHRRYHDLQHLAIELAAAEEPDDSAVEPSIAGIAKGVEMVLRRLKRIERGIQELKDEIAGLRYYEHHLVAELHKKMDYVMNYSVQLEERKVPQLFYFVDAGDGQSWRRLVTRIVPGMRALRVQMLCEFRREMHVVEDQIGCELMQVDNEAVKRLLPYMSGFMKLLTLALKIGAHLVVGMGEMIPDLSREVVHLLSSSSSSLALGAAAAAAATASAVSVRMHKNSSSRSRSSRSSSGDDMRAARQWLVDFLRGQGIASGMDIARRFGLWRVRYRDDGHIAWICRKHIAARGDEIFELPL